MRFHRTCFSREAQPLQCISIVYLFLGLATARHRGHSRYLLQIPPHLFRHGRLLHDRRNRNDAFWFRCIPVRDHHFCQLFKLPVAVPVAVPVALFDNPEVFCKPLDGRLVQRPVCVRCDYHASADRLGMFCIHPLRRVELDGGVEQEGFVSVHVFHIILFDKLVRLAREELVQGNVLLPCEQYTDVLAILSREDNIGGQCV
ncbi:hypothetical protein DFH11DRAFT_1292818 [Phellopilus nigrolimitatus]|nr:hypothetical protein DFH11DRAFT_1292818 [Phellopilus nigrolimitatus]